MPSTLTKAEIEKIVKDELKKFVTDSLPKEMKKELGNISSPVRKEMMDAIKKAQIELAKFMWFRKEVWVNNIK